jgi:hypothetical protein
MKGARDEDSPASSSKTGQILVKNISGQILDHVMVQRTLMKWTGRARVGNRAGGWNVNYWSNAGQMLAKYADYGSNDSRAIIPTALPERADAWRSAKRGAGGEKGGGFRQFQVRLRQRRHDWL